jgi:hypothetical protein
MQYVLLLIRLQKPFAGDIRVGRGRAALLNIPNTDPINVGAYFVTTVDSGRIATARRPHGPSDANIGFS